MSSFNLGDTQPSCIFFVPSEIAVVLVSNKEFFSIIYFFHFISQSQTPSPPSLVLTHPSPLPFPFSSERESPLGHHLTLGHVEDAEKKLERLCDTLEHMGESQTDLTWNFKLSLFISYKP